MKIFSKVLLTISLLGFAVGLSNVGEAMFSGLARALGAVFFILYFITRVAMAADKEAAETTETAELKPVPDCEPARPNDKTAAQPGIPNLGDKTAVAHM